MGRHREWRKIVKKESRRRKRTLRAMLLDKQNSLEEDEASTSLELEQIEMLNRIENEKWLSAEKILLERWQVLQRVKEKMIQKQIHQKEKLKLEYELEQKKRIEEEERLKKIHEENKRKQDLFVTKLEYFLSRDSINPPEELLTIRETRPTAQVCPFFIKTACCRFGDQCSRNHQYPGISKVLLATNFYSHFGLENANFNEYDTDVMLEYEDTDTYKEFKDFFYDVIPEFEKFGTITQFKVCKNYEKHLRGNTYIEFSELRCAVAAYQALHTRWYGGRQLSLQFCSISSWKNAICGLQSRNRCPKGRACNFLHVFRNPNNTFTTTVMDTPKIREKDDSQRNSRLWRWSESPEVEILNIKKNKSRIKLRTRDRSPQNRSILDKSRRRTRENRKKEIKTL